MANFPTRKISEPLSQMAFPNDLLANPDRPYVALQFVTYRTAFYSGTSLGSSLTGLAQKIGVPTQITNPTGSVILPLPKKINENQELLWNETSLMDLLTSVAPGLSRFANLPPAVSALSGLQVNPFQLMYFQRPAFKQYAFTWTLAPNTPSESKTLQKIINDFKRNSLPRAVGPLFDYPNIAIIKFFPNNLNNHIFLKPCAITSVQIDHAGTTTPSFFKNSGGAPVLVNLTIQLKEIDIWTQNDYIGEGYGLGSFLNEATGALTSAATSVAEGLGSLTER